MGDVFLAWGNGSADLNIQDNDLGPEEGLRTAVLLSLFTDRRANDGDELPGVEQDKRGWWGDEFLEDQDDRIGSKLWLLERSKMGPNLAADVEAYDREALQWMIDDLVVESIDVEVIADGQSLYHSITLHRPGKDSVKFRFPHVWEGEAGRDADPIIVASESESEPPPSAPNLLANFDFSAPVAVGIGGNGTFASTFATDEWLFQEASGAYPNNVGTETLVNTGGLQGQQAVGLWDGSSYIARKAWESTSGANHLDASGTTAGDCDNEDAAGRVVFRANGIFSGDYLMSKRHTASSAGWRLLVSAAPHPTMALGDGTNTTTNTLTVGEYGDGAWHVVSWFYDYSEGLLWLKSEFGEQSFDVSVITDSMSNSRNLKVNSWLGSTRGMPSCQYAYAGVSVGANAQNFYDESIVLPGADPTGLLTTQARGSLISVPVSAAHIAHFADDQLPIGHNASLSDANKLGLHCNSAVTNLVPYSERSTGATNTNTTPTDNAADSPDGFRSATSLLATANGGFQQKTCVTSAGAEYTGSIYLEEGTTGVQGRVVAYDLTNGAEIAATAYTATDTPVDTSVTFTTPAGCVSVGLRCEIATNGETVIPSFWQLNLGSARGAYIRTNGAAASLAASDYSAVGDLLSNAAGEIRAVAVTTLVNGGLDFVYSSSAPDEHALHHAGDGNMTISVYDDAGAPEDQIASSGEAAPPGTEVVLRQLWDSETGIDGGAYKQVLFQNDTRFNGGAFPWDGAPSVGFASEVFLGQRHNSTGSHNGVIQSMQIYDGPGAL